MTWLGGRSTTAAPASVLAVHASVGYLNSLRAQFLDDAVSQERAPVLATDGLTRLTMPLVWALRRAGGVWAVEESDGGFRDGLTGQGFGSALVQELFAGREPHFAEKVATTMPLNWPATGEHSRSGSGGDNPWTAWQVKVSVRVEHSGQSASRIGASAEALLHAVQQHETASGERVGSWPASWGVVEPPLTSWNREFLGQHFGQVNRRQVTFVGQPGYAATGVLRVERTKTAVREWTDAVLSSRFSAREADGSTDGARRAFQELAGRQHVTSGLVLGRVGQWDVSVRSQGEEKPEPVALYLGAVTMARHLIRSADVVDLLDGTSTPDGGVFLPLATKRESGWERLAVLEQTVGNEVLAGLFLEEELDVQW